MAIHVPLTRPAVAAPRWDLLHALRWEPTDAATALTFPEAALTHRQHCNGGGGVRTPDPINEHPIANHGRPQTQLVNIP